MLRFTPRQPTPVRQKPFEIRQKLAYIASSMPKIFGVTYDFSSMDCEQMRFPSSEHDFLLSKHMSISLIRQLLTG